MMKRATMMMVAGLALCLGAQAQPPLQHIPDIYGGQWDLGDNESVCQPDLRVYDGTDGVPALVNLYHYVDLDGGLSVHGSSTVNLYDPDYIKNMGAYDNSTINIYYHMGSHGSASGNSTINVYGGSFGGGAYGGGTLNIYGGALYYVSAGEAGTVNIYGGDFAIDGVPVPVPTTITAADEEQLTGTLADGTPVDGCYLFADGGTINLLPPSSSVVEAVIDIDPGTLNLGSNGQWITCYIELPEGYDAEEIDGSTVTLAGVPAHLGKEGWAKAFATAGNTTDRDGDGLFERMVKFDRAAVAALLEPGEVELTVTGELGDGTVFAGTDVIRVTANGKKK